MSPFPNFFIAGVPKAGTTALYHYLRQHPQIYMSPHKEPTYFGAADLLTGRLRDVVVPALEANRDELEAYLEGPMPVPEHSQLVFKTEQYEKLFRPVRDEIAVGEASVTDFF